MPPLLEKMAALQHLESGQVVKVHLRFHEPFWIDRLPNGARELGFTISFDSPFPTFWDQHPLHRAILTGWAGGPAAVRLLALNHEEIQAVAIASVAQTFDVSESFVALRCVECLWHRWHDDPFSRGPYSYPAVGGLEAAKVLARPVANTLFFAGEATDSHGHNGTVHGAIISGQRAATEILTSLGGRD